MRLTRQSRTCFVALSITFLVMGCAQKVEPIETGLKNEAMPIFGIEGYSLSALQVGRKNAPGAVLTNCVAIDDLEQLRTNSFRTLLVAKDDLVRDFVQNECSLQINQPDRPNIPLQFLRKEEFVVFHLNDQAEITSQNIYYWQNVKVLAKGAR